MVSIERVVVVVVVGSQGIQIKEMHEIDRPTSFFDPLDAFYSIPFYRKLPPSHLLYSSELNSIKCPVLYCIDHHH